MKSKMGELVYTHCGWGTVVGVKGDDKGVPVIKGFDYMVHVPGQRYFIGLFED